MNNFWEIMAKHLLLQCGQTKHVAEFASKLQTTQDINALLLYLSQCNRFYIFLLSAGCNVYDQQQREYLITTCQQEIHRCEQRIQEIANKALIDMFLSQITQNN